MAKDVITRFKLETTAFDSALKKSAKELLNFSREATQAGKGFDDFTKKNIEAARALGSIATNSVKPKDKLKELVGAFNEAARAYNGLNDTQKQSDWAQALAGSLTTLQQRIRDTKIEMQSLNTSMPKMDNIASGGGDNEFTAAFTGLTGQFTKGNLYAAAVMEAKAALQDLYSTMKQTVAEGVDLARQGEGIRIAFERINKPGLLDNLREATHGTVSDLELMKSAVRFNDFNLPLSELGTMLAFAQKKAKDTGQSIDYLVESIVNGLGRQSPQILDNLGLSQAEVKRRTKETGDMTVAVGQIIREQMSQSGEYVGTAADRMAKANAELANKSEELGRKLLEPDLALTKLKYDMKVGFLKYTGEVVDGLNVLNQKGTTAFDRLKSAIEKIHPAFNGLHSIVNSVDNAFQKFGIDTSKVFDILKIKVLRIYTPLLSVLELLRLIGREKSKLDSDPVSGGGGFGGRTGNTYTPPKIDIDPVGRGGGYTHTDPIVKTEEQIRNEQIEALTKEYLTASEDRRSAIIAEIAELKRLNAEYERLKAEATGGKISNEFSISAQKTVEVGKPAYNEMLKQQEASLFTSGNLATLTTNLKKELQSAEIGSEIYSSLTAQLADATALGNLITTSIKNGIDVADWGAVEFWKKILNDGNIDESILQNALDKINEQLVAKGLAPLSMNFNTGDLSSTTELSKSRLNEKFDKAISGLRQVASGLQNLGVKLPEGVTRVISAIQGISQIIQGVQAAINVFSTSSLNLNTIAVNANTTALIAQGVTSKIASVGTNLAATGGIVKSGKILHAATGSVVPGNYGYDAVPALLTSGEIVLNRAQQGVLANVIENEGKGNMHTQPYVSGEMIFLAVNNYLRRSGYGEILTSKRG